ncbi:unnamed protein product [Durusdinium trenchii]|uniref:Peptidase S54 rhomboid domain-containing protein n=2 Tax=Durusdinium trenchii TaxID=1381693 RepID=A0ABP0QFH9_9DINO
MLCTRYSSSCLLRLHRSHRRPSHRPAWGRAAARSSSSNPWWNEELERRQKRPLRPLQPTQAPREATPSTWPTQDRGSERQDWQESASSLQLFAYPEDRRIPWASLSLLVTSACATLAAAGLWQQVLGSSSMEELEERLERFTNTLKACSAKWPLQVHELHGLLLASLLRAGELPNRALSDLALLLFGGTLLERLYGAPFMLLFLGVSTMLSNAMAMAIQQRFVEGVEGLSSTSGGLVALGTFCALRHPRWAIWPGVPIPVSWLMAPVVVADLSLAWAYRQELKAFESAQAGDAHARDDHAGAERAMALAACIALEAQARAECRPVWEELRERREELELAAEEDVLPPEATLWADLSGILIGTTTVIMLSLLK